MRFDVITLFPELFTPFLISGVTRRAYEAGLVDVKLWNPRDFADGNYRRVIDLFALQDHLALPVVDGAGHLVGVVAVDDVLEELLAERLPGQGRYARVRRRALALAAPRRRAHPPTEP